MIAGIWSPTPRVETQQCEGRQLRRPYLPFALLAGMSRADSACIRIHVSAGAEIVTRSGIGIGLLVRRDVHFVILIPRWFYCVSYTTTVRELRRTNTTLKLISP
jgi:hypothetical protein